MKTSPVPPLPYDPETLPQEKARHYIPATDQDIEAMCAALGVSQLGDLFQHIPTDVRMPELSALPEELAYDQLYQHMVAQSRKNRIPEVSFVGDALLHYPVHDLVPFVSGLRELLTAYTPYQPERSQGTLMTHWLYQSCLTALTGFEAINASQYDRATALGEGLAAVVFPQVNHVGCLEDVDGLTDLAHALGVPAIAVIEPMLLGSG